MKDILSTIDINPNAGTPNASVIWLHGLGADGNDFVPIAERLQFKPGQNIRFVFPHAPTRAITINGGMHMRGWYDIQELTFALKEDLIGIQRSAQSIDLLIEREQSLGIKSERIVLAGFSQGGAMALHTGLRFPKPIAGIVALSGYLPLASTLENERTAVNQSTPIFMAHGTFDSIVPFSLAQLSQQKLEALGCAVHWHPYPMTHTLIPEEVDHIEQFLQKILS